MPADLPANGYFSLDDMFQGSSYSGYPRYMRTKIFLKAQTLLKASGLYSAEPDGATGPKSQQAVIAYQRQQGISASGRLDSATLQAMKLNGIRLEPPDPPKQVAMPSPPERPRNPAASPAPADSIPLGRSVRGKPGFVTSPFAPSSGLIDVTGMESGTKVRDPYTGNVFRVP